LQLIIRLPFGHLLAALTAFLGASVRSPASLQLEILAPRHQIGVLQRSVKLPKLTPTDRFLWAWLCSVWKKWFVDQVKAMGINQVLSAPRSPS